MDADEEEVAYSVEDTNFRLCEIAGLSAPPPALLSAQWDRNDRDTLYLSHGYRPRSQSEYVCEHA